MKKPLSRFLPLLVLLAAGLCSPVAAVAASAEKEAQRLAKFDAEFKVFDELDRAHPPAPGGVLFVGSSIFRQWTTVAEQMAPLPALNRAFGGSRTADQLERFDRVVRPYAPRLIVYYCGSNDINAGAQAPEIAANFRTFVARVHAALPATRIVYASILRAPQKQDHWDIVETANALVREFCATDPRLAFVDLNPAVFDAQGRPRLELYRPDRLHYLPPAYEGFTKLLKPELLRTWAALAPTP